MAIISNDAQHASVPASGSLRRVVDDDPALIVTDSVELAVVRRLQGSKGLAGARLTGTWSGQPTPLPLAYASLR
jgi:hypothetical protein